MTPEEQMEIGIGAIRKAFDTNEGFRKHAIKSWDEARQRIEELKGELEASKAESERLNDLRLIGVEVIKGLKAEKKEAVEALRGYRQSIAELQAENKGLIDEMASDRITVRERDRFLEILQLKRRNVELEGKIDGIITLVDSDKNKEPLTFENTTIESRGGVIQELGLEPPE